MMPSTNSFASTRQQLDSGKLVLMFMFETLVKECRLELVYWLGY